MVCCNLDQQYERLIHRDKLDFKQARSRIESQLPIKIKKDFADQIIDNSNNLNLVKKQINKLF